ncbi:MAG: hypothetical protein H0V10_10500 [Geodermatophilaceae bacterium]|nr:hypothetical protein [Geodermatophilaceae bacterium]
MRWDGDSYQPQILDVDDGTIKALDAPVYDRLDWISDFALSGVAYDEEGYTTYLFQLDAVTGDVQRMETGVDDVGSRVLWSPDRTQFAYDRPVDYRLSYDRAARPTIQIHDLETGRERTVPGSDTLETGCSCGPPTTTCCSGRTLAEPATTSRCLPKADGPRSGSSAPIGTAKPSAIHAATTLFAPPSAVLRQSP